MKNATENESSVLVGILKTKRDLDLALHEHWYRMPVRHAPLRKFSYLAFYQPSSFGNEGKRITYYARALSLNLSRRTNLLPQESNNPRAQNLYWRVRLGKLQKLQTPIHNTAPRRVTFGFTTLKNLRHSKNMLALFKIPPTEMIMQNALRREGIRTIPQHYVYADKKRFRLDFAIHFPHGNLAIECDNRKAHTGPQARARDRAKDLALEHHSWQVLRFTDHEILFEMKKCMQKIRRILNTS